MTFDVFSCLLILMLESQCFYDWIQGRALRHAVDLFAERVRLAAVITSPWHCASQCNKVNEVSHPNISTGVYKSDKS